MFLIHHSEDVLPSIHADKYYPCELVGTWNTWYGEQDQAGRITNINIKQTSAVWHKAYMVLRLVILHVHTDASIPEQNFIPQKNNYFEIDQW